MSMGKLELIAGVCVLGAAAIMASVLLSNKAGINLHHNHKIHITKSYTLKCDGLISKNCSVFFTRTIGHTENYSGLITYLGKASARDTIKFYITGNGGYVHSTLALYIAIKQSKAKTITIVTGDVYSGHAVLAVAGKEIVVKNKHAIILFHRSSIYSVEDGWKECYDRHAFRRDRRQSATAKCMAYIDALLAQDKHFIESTYGKLLTADELHRVLIGWDVLLTGAELQLRIKVAKAIGKEKQVSLTK